MSIAARLPHRRFIRAAEIVAGNGALPCLVSQQPNGHGTVVARDYYRQVPYCFLRALPSATSLFPKSPSQSTKASLQCCRRRACQTYSFFTGPNRRRRTSSAALTVRRTLKSARPISDRSPLYARQAASSAHSIGWSGRFMSGSVPTSGNHESCLRRPDLHNSRPAISVSRRSVHYRRIAVRPHGDRGVDAGRGWKARHFDKEGQ